MQTDYYVASTVRWPTHHVDVRWEAKAAPWIPWYSSGPEGVHLPKWCLGRCQTNFHINGMDSQIISQQNKAFFYPILDLGDISSSTTIFQCSHLHIHCTVGAFSSGQGSAWESTGAGYASICDALCHETCCLGPLLTLSSRHHSLALVKFASILPDALCLL